MICENLYSVILSEATQHNFDVLDSIGAFLD